MIAQILSFIKSSQLINPNEIIIAAVSGGVDSMVMLDCLNQIKNELHFSLEVVHINHGIRGRDADLDELLVYKSAAKMKLPFHSEKLIGFKLNSNEDDLRVARYAVFDRLIDERPGAKIATAHTLDDQFETFLMRLAKGSKLNGLCGIPVKRDALIRPLLFLKKTELRAYAELHNIPYREDVTNFEVEKTRNKIRNQIIPELVKVLGEDVFEGFRSSHADLVQVNEYLKQQVALSFQNITRVDRQGLFLITKEYLSLDTKVRHLILESCVSWHYPLNFGIPSGYFHEFESFVENAENGSLFEFRDGLKVAKLREGLLFQKVNETNTTKLELYPGEVVYTGNYELRISEADKSEVDFKKAGWIEYICGDKIKWPIHVRIWEEGDWFYPLGSDYRQKLSDFFINEKIEKYEKKQVPIVVDGDNVIWIAGLRLDNRYRFSKTCKKIYKLELRLITES